MKEDIPMKTNYVVGVDIGGSHITAGLINIEARTLASGSLVRKAVDPHAAATAIIDTWAETIQEAAAVLDGAPCYIGIAMPGPFDYEQGISLIRGFNKYESLYGLNVKEMLGQELGIPAAAIKLKNDAAAFLQGEVLGGAAAGYQQAIGLTLGTGLGSARMVGNDTVTRAVNVSPLHNGMAEDYISIRWFLQRYKELTGQMAANVKYIADRVGQDPLAAQIFCEFAGNLAIVLQRSIVEEQPDVVVLGGGIANAFELFYPALQKQLTGTGNIPIKQSLLGEAAAMTGAACCWNNGSMSSSILQTNQNLNTPL
jgi:glucokinase